MPKTVQKNTDIYQVHEVDCDKKIVWILVAPRDLLISFKKINGKIKSVKRKFQFSSGRNYGKDTYLPPNMYREAIRLAAGVIKDRF